MKKDGGCAFPVIGGNSQAFGPYGDSENVTAGMSLRDYFAAKVLTGILGRFSTPPVDPDFIATIIAECSYAIADAMIKERNK